MRITNNMLITGLLHNVNKNLIKMSEYQDELATGKKNSITYGRSHRHL